MEVATKEVEAFPAFSEVHDPRLLRVQLQSQFAEDFPHQFQGASASSWLLHKTTASSA